MPLSPAAWKLAGRAAAHQLWTLVGDVGQRRKKARPIPVAVLDLPSGERTVIRFVDANDPPAEAKKAARMADAPRYVMAADAELAASQDALVLMVHEGRNHAQVVIAYNTPFKVIAVEGMPISDASRDALREGLREHEAWAAIEHHLGPLGDDSIASVPIKRLAPVTAQFERFRIRGGILERLKEDGTPKGRLPLGPHIKASLVRERQLAVSAIAVGIAAGVLGGSWVCAGPGGLACGALPALFFLFVAAYGVVFKKYLRLDHDGSIERWLCKAELDHPDLVAFADAINADPGPPSGGEMVPATLATPSTTPAPIAPDAIARRAMTDASLAATGVRAPDVAPMIARTQTRLRSARQAAERAIALWHVSQANHTPKPTLDDEAQALLTLDERAFVKNPDPATTDLFSTRPEAAATLMWALGWLRAPLSYSKEIRPDALETVLAPKAADLDNALSSAALRETDEILDLLDAVVCRRWLIEQARVEGQEPPPGLNAAVLLERQYALLWLTQLDDARDVDWDEVICQP